MKKIPKLKELLRESNVWDRKFGESLPTLAQTSARYAAKQNKVNEEDLTEANTLPPFEIAKRMMKSKYWQNAGKGFSEKVIKKFRGRGVSAKALDKWLPDYIDGKEISALFEGKLTEAGKYQVSSQPYKAWQEHSDHNNKLFNDAHWAMKAFPNKKKEIKEIQQLSSKLKNLIEIIKGQAIDL